MSCKIIKPKTIILFLSLFTLGKITAQTTPTPPYMFITQQQFGSLVTVVDPTNTSPPRANSFNIPTTLDYGAEFSVYADVPKDGYAGKIIYLYLKDSDTGTGATNGGSNTLPASTALRFTLDNSTNTDASIDRYRLTIPAGNYPVLMNSVAAWNAMLDGTMIYTAFYIYSANSNGTSQATVISNQYNNVSIAGFKNLLKFTPPETNNPDVVIELNQYDPVMENLEDMLVNGVTLSNGQAYALPSPQNDTTYSWYYNDPYGGHPHIHAVNSQYKWLNTLYQGGIKPWINTSHIDMSNPAYISTNSAGDACYTLNYYIIPTPFIPKTTQYVLGPNNIPSGEYVDTLTFRNNARKVVVKIKPATASNLIPYPITIADQDYGRNGATGSSNWGPELPSGQTTYTYNNNYLPSDGQYAIAKDIVGTLTNGGRPPDWYVPSSGGNNAPAQKYDHTYNDGTGYMYMVNATETPGTFYHNTFDVCQSMNLQFSLWLMDMSNGTRLYINNDNSVYRIKPNVYIQIYSGTYTTDNPPTNATPLLEYYTGEIPMTGIWERYSTPIFKVPQGTSNISVYYRSVTGGGNGNDFLIDDIQIERSNGAFNFSVEDFAPCLSPSDSYRILADWNTEAIMRIYPTPPPSFYYQWKFYAGATDPGDISGSGTDPEIAAGSPPISGWAEYPGTGGISLIVPGNQMGVYKLTISDTESNINNFCSTNSFYVLSTEIPYITSSVTGPICPGEPVILTVHSTPVNVPQPDNLIWFMRDTVDNTILIPLLTPSGDQASGISVTVNPLVTTTYVVEYFGCSSYLECQIATNSDTEVDFGPQLKTTDYVYRIGYNASTVEIPIKYGKGTGDISYMVLPDGMANGVILAVGQLSSPDGTGMITFNPDIIQPDLENFRNGINTITCGMTLADDAGCGNVQRFQIRFISEETVWSPGLNSTTPTDNTNWNNDANWYITDSLGNRYAEAGVPLSSTKVIIPGDAANYPVLKADYTETPNLPTDDGFTPQPKCDSIIFQFGGEVAQLQYLQYTRASVEMNFGTYDASATFSNTASMMNTDGGTNYYPYYLERNRYYSMSAPLKDMYAGDLAFGGKPNAYLKYADPILIAATTDAFLIQKWSNSIPDYNIPLDAGMGFGYEVFSGDLSENWPYKNNQKNLNAVSGLVRLPYFTNSSYLANINPHHNFVGDASTGAGTSTFTYYIEGMPENTTDKMNTVTRKTASTKNVPLANRFIAENDADVIPANYPVVSISAEQHGSEILAGNPFMSHLDFKSFYLKNSTTVGQYYRIWLGTAQYYSVSVDNNGNYVASTDPALDGDDAGNDMLIAPMQSFFVPILSASSGNNEMIFDVESMSVTKSDKNTALRSALVTNDKEILKIIASNSRYSAVAVIINKTGESVLGSGVPKLFSPSGNIPEIYLQQDYKKEIIEINQHTQSIPLGIKTGVKGEMFSLSFQGLEKFSSDVSILDTKTGITQPLTVSDNEFKFLNTEGDQDNRFYLLFSPKEITGIDQLANKNVLVWTVNEVVKVHSSQADPILSVEIFNMQGQLLSVNKNLSAVSYESDRIKEMGVYVVKIKTKQNSMTKKIIIK